MKLKHLSFIMIIGLAVALAGCSVTSLFNPPATTAEPLEMLHEQGEVDPDEPAAELPIVEDELEYTLEGIIDDELFELTDEPGLDAIIDLATGAKVTVQSGKLRKGSSFETTYYVITAPKAGPTLMITGGVHGNERAGYTAAEQIVKTLRPDKGRIVIVPRANMPATKRNTRGVSSLADLNRMFPLGKNPTGQTAREIYALVKKYKPNFFLDLHEGYDYNIVNKKSVGQSVIVYPVGRALGDAQAVVTKLNSSNIIKKGTSKRFVLIRNPVKGSLARKVGQDLRIPSAIIETVSKEPLARRVDFQLTAVKTIAARLGIILK